MYLGELFNLGHKSFGLLKVIHLIFFFNNIIICFNSFNILNAILVS